MSVSVSSLTLPGPPSWNRTPEDFEMLFTDDFHPVEPANLFFIRSLLRASQKRQVAADPEGLCR